MKDDVYANDLLNMTLHEVSDLFLEKLCESGDRFVLRVCLCKKEVK